MSYPRFSVQVKLDFVTHLERVYLGSHWPVRKRVLRLDLMHP